jgi:hypothetical protein
MSKAALSERVDSFSGSDIEQICKAAIMAPVRILMSASAHILCFTPWSAHAGTKFFKRVRVCVLQILES